MTYLARGGAERAAALLCDTDRAVASMATAGSWPDPDYFARAFTAHYGTSPRE